MHAQHLAHADHLFQYGVQHHSNVESTQTEVSTYPPGTRPRADQTNCANRPITAGQPMQADGTD